MSKKRKMHSAEFKFKIALEGAKGVKTISQIASEHSLHPNQISNWKKQLLTEGKAIFRKRNSREEQERAAREAELYEQIGRLKMELEWLKKKLVL